MGGALADDGVRFEPLTATALESGPEWFREIELRPDCWRDDDTRAIAMTDAGRVVGAGMMWTSRPHPYRYWASVVVDPEHRRQGLGRRLVERLASLRASGLPLMSRGFLGSGELAFADALGAVTIQLVPPAEIGVSHRGVLRELPARVRSGAEFGAGALADATARMYEWTHAAWSPVGPDWAEVLPRELGFPDEIDLEASTVAVDEAGRPAAVAVVFADSEPPVLIAETVAAETPDGERLVEASVRRALEVLAARGVRVVEFDGHVTDPHFLPNWIKLEPHGRWFRLVELP